MKKLIWTYGIISGLIITVLMIGMTPLWQQEGQMDMQMGELLGYISMIVSLSMIFFGVKNYRDKHKDGVITFGKAFKVGFLITLVASAFYVVGWMIYFNTSETAQDFPEQYLEYMLTEMEEDGATAEEVAETRTTYEGQMELYKNPFVMMGVTLMEILPVGLLISLLTAFILKRKEK